MDDIKLASLYQRFMAAMVDSAPFLVTTLIKRWDLAAKSNIPHFWALWIGFLLVWVVVQIILISETGQSIGKKIYRTRIVRVDTGLNGGFVTNILKRGVLNSVLNLIPLYALVDQLFIFSVNRRCVHDLIAGTIVVRVD